MASLVWHFPGSPPMACARQPTHCPLSSTHRQPLHHTAPTSPALGFTAWARGLVSPGTALGSYRCPAPAELVQEKATCAEPSVRVYCTRVGQVWDPPSLSQYYTGVRYTQLGHSDSYMQKGTPDISAPTPSTVNVHKTQLVTLMRTTHKVSILVVASSYTFYNQSVQQLQILLDSAYITHTLSTHGVQHVHSAPGPVHPASPAWPKSGMTPSSARRHSMPITFHDTNVHVHLVFVRMRLLCMYLTVCVHVGEHGTAGVHVGVHGTVVVHAAAGAYRCGEKASNS